MEPISKPIQLLLDLFATALSDVRFADLSAEMLAQLASEVDAAAVAVAAAQAALDAASLALKDKQEALLQQAQRALAYARVYAENDDVLSQQLDGVALPRAARRLRGGGEALILSAEPPPAATPRPRGRPKRLRDEPMLDAVLAPAE
jgi:hypothetical protein